MELNQDNHLIKLEEKSMVKKTRKGKSIGRASKACAQISKKTGKKIRTKAERKRCMQRYLSGGKSGKKRKVKRRRKRK